MRCGVVQLKSVQGLDELSGVVSLRNRHYRVDSAKMNPSARMDQRLVFVCLFVFVFCFCLCFAIVRAV